MEAEASRGQLAAHSSLGEVTLGDGLLGVPKGPHMCTPHRCTHNHAHMLILMFLHTTLIHTSTHRHKTTSIHTPTYTHMHTNLNIH